MITFNDKTYPSILDYTRNISSVLDEIDKIENRIELFAYLANNWHSVKSEPNDCVWCVAYNGTDFILCFFNSIYFRWEEALTRNIVRPIYWTYMTYDKLEGIYANNTHYIGFDKEYIEENEIRTTIKIHPDDECEFYTNFAMTTDKNELFPLSYCVKIKYKEFVQIFSVDPLPTISVIKLIKKHKDTQKNTINLQTHCIETE